MLSKSLERIEMKIPKIVEVVWLSVCSVLQDRGKLQVLR